MELLSELRSSPALSHFTDEQLGLLAGIGSQRTLEEGEEMFGSGDGLSHLFLILQGRLAIRRDTPAGWVAFWHLEAGELLGVTSFITGRAILDSALAESEVRVVAFDHQSLVAAIQEDPAFERDLLWAFWRSTAGDLALANERLASFFDKDGSAPRRPKPAVSPGGTLELGQTSKKALFREQMLSDDEVDLLAAVTKERRFSPGHLIFAEGDPGDEMYVVHEGEIVISKFIPGAGDEALAFLRRGDYFGEMVLIGGQRRSADARARSDGAVVLAIPTSEVEKLFAERDERSIGLIRLLCTAAANRLRAMLLKITGWHELAGGDSF